MIIGSRISRLFLVLGLYALIPLALIAAGLFIFFWGRRYVERKHGRKRD